MSGWDAAPPSGYTFAYSFTERGWDYEVFEHWLYGTRWARRRHA